MAFTLVQLKALAIVPKFTGLLSMVGSSVIILDVLRDRKKQTQTYSRIMASMSAFDFVTSLMYALSTWPIPKGSGPLYAAGTVQSCTFQGFFIQLSLAAPLYNFSLAVYYLLVIKYSWSDIRLARVEKYVHPTIATIAIGIAIAGLPLNIFNNANVWCWIAPSDRMSNPGDANQIYRWAFYYVELWTIIIAITAIMFSVVVAVVRTDRKSSRYNRRARLSNTVKKQALYYVSAFYITWTFPTTLRILQTVGTTVPYAIFLCAVIFTPMQGFFNCIIYLRPRYLRRRREAGGAEARKSAPELPISRSVQPLPFQIAESVVAPPRLLLPRRAVDGLGQRRERGRGRRKRRRGRGRRGGVGGGRSKGRGRRRIHGRECGRRGGIGGGQSRWRGQRRR